MSNLIATDSMKLEPGSEYVELFELEYTTGSWVYFHPGLNSDLTSVQFRNRDNPSIINTYSALPMEMTGVEWSTEGALNRPTITVANVLDVFRTSIGNQTAEDLIGKKIVRRRTLKKYLYGEASDSSPPVEWPVQIYIIDRVASMNAIQIQYELASPMDLPGVEIPSRKIIGKLCPWRYQGAAIGIDGCLFPLNSEVTIPTVSGVTSTLAFFDSQDNILLPFGHPVISGAWPTGVFVGSGYRTYNSSTDAPGGISGVYLIPSSYDPGPPPVPSTSNIRDEGYVRVYTYTSYSTGTTYSFGNLVIYGGNIWKSLQNLNIGNTPAEGSRWWTRNDLCSKSMDGCRLRFQYQALITGGVAVETKSSDVIAPHFEPNTDISSIVPFGGFPPSEKI